MLLFSPFRNRRFISRPIQGRLMSRVALYWVLYHLVLWHSLLVYRYVEFRMSGTSASFADQFGQVLVDYAPILLCGLLTLPVVLIDMLWVSHRIAGPLVQFGLALRELQDGRTIDRVVLRRQDLLTEFQEEFNEYLAWLKWKSAAPAGLRGGPPSVTTADEVRLGAQSEAHRPPVSQIDAADAGPGLPAGMFGPPVCSP